MTLQFNPYPIIQPRTDNLESFRNLTNTVGEFGNSIQEARKQKLAMAIQQEELARKKAEDEWLNSIPGADVTLGMVDSDHQAPSGMTQQNPLSGQQPMGQSPAQLPTFGGLPNNQAPTQNPQMQMPNQAPQRLNPMLASAGTNNVGIAQPMTGQQDLVSMSQNHDWEQYKSRPKPMLGNSTTNYPKPTGLTNFQLSKNLDLQQKQALTKKTQYEADLAGRKEGFKAQNYTDAEGKVRIGKWDSQNGLTISPNDPMAEPKANTSQKAPPGFRWTENGDLEMIPGGPADMKSQEQTKKDSLVDQKVDTAYDLYETARDGLLSGLKGSVTGPILGRIPAFTSKQQIAQGGAAAMAPVLKQLFRVSGEGVFTDRDQALLLQMIPSRETNPDAVPGIIENIDRIVKAKLGRSGGSVNINVGQQKPITATNKQTGQKIQSFDGGKTWQQAQ
jgi:hypothetical protein